MCDRTWIFLIWLWKNEKIFIQSWKFEKKDCPKFLWNEEENPKLKEKKKKMQFFFTSYNMNQIGVPLIIVCK